MKHDFIMSKKTLILGILLFVLLWITSIIIAVVISNHRPQEQAIKANNQVVILNDSIFENLLCKMLVKPLKEREGFRTKPYILKGKWYVGYGHYLCSANQNEWFNKVMSNKVYDKEYLEYLFESDIKKCVVECKRVKAKVNYRNLYNIFISGKISK